jgi:hypothetical protein
MKKEEIDLVLMKIEREFPKLIPMYDQKVKVFYQGIKRSARVALNITRTTAK